MFFCATFLQRLPPPFRLQIAEDRHLPVHLLAAWADTLMAHHIYNAVAALVSAYASCDQDSTVTAVRNAKGKEWRKNKSKAPQGGRGNAASKKEPWDLLGICRFHYKYVEHCYKCTDPSSCKWAAGN